ncbi:MAG: hypothetical protein WB697_12635 [Stellaceae bacterium]
MAKTVEDFFVERLYQWGVRRIYGYPGDGVFGAARQVLASVLPGKGK